MSTPKELFEGQIAEKTKNPDAQKKVNATYRFDLTGPNGGTWIVDFKEGSAGVRQADEAGQCTITMADDDFLSLLSGKLNPQMAFMSGKLKVKGDMALAMKLGSVLQA
jgi:putative sterol carrier protein